jgi:hypothetical protein
MRAGECPRGLASLEEVGPDGVGVAPTNRDNAVAGGILNVALGDPEEQLEVGVVDHVASGSSGVPYRGAISKDCADRKCCPSTIQLTHDAEAGVRRGRYGDASDLRTCSRPELTRRKRRGQLGAAERPTEDGRWDELEHQEPGQGQHSDGDGHPFLRTLKRSKQTAAPPISTATLEACCAPGWPTKGTVIMTASHAVSSRSFESRAARR